MTGIASGSIRIKPIIDRALISFGALAIVFAVCCAILYLMGLSIFERSALEWTFVYGIVAAGIGISALILRAVWDVQ